MSSNPLIGIGSTVIWSGYEFELIEFETHKTSDGTEVFAILSNPTRTTAVPISVLEKALVSAKAA